NSQSGNNNTYCQDNPTGWIDWSKLGSDDDLTGFIAALADLRRRFSQLRPRNWLIGSRDDGSYDVKWLTPAGTEMTPEDWNYPDGHFLSYVLACDDPDGEPLLIVLNAADHELEITFTEWAGIHRWICLLDTSNGEIPSGSH